MEHARGWQVHDRVHSQPTTLRFEPGYYNMSALMFRYLKRRATTPASKQPAFSDYKETLEDAQMLLSYAAENGHCVDDDTRNAVLKAEQVFHDGAPDEATIADLLNALCKLATLVSPVTAESLRTLAATGGRPPYRKWAIGLAVFIVFYSTVSFVTSSIADSIRADITTANALAVKLGSEFPPTTTSDTGNNNPGDPTKASNAATKENSTKQPVSEAASEPCPIPIPETPVGPVEKLPERINRSDVIQDLQLYSSSIRNIDAHALQLVPYVQPWRFVVAKVRWLLGFESKNPDWLSDCRNPQDPYFQKVFELPVPLTNYTAAVEGRTAAYQYVRYFGQSAADDVTFYYGAITSCILPALYALLGAFAYILRTFEQRVATRAYVRTRADSARFVIAAIGGAVVGLFSDLTPGQGIKVSPLALAFLVGYAVDVFYAFLESLIVSFTNTALGSAGKVPPPPPDSGEAVAKEAPTPPSGDAAKAAGAGS